MKKTYSYLYLISLDTKPTVARREIRPKTDTDTPVIISSSWFAIDGGAAVVCVVVDAAVVSVIAVVGVVDGLVVGSGDGGSSFKNKNKTEVISQLNINDMSCIYHTYMIFKVQVLRKKILFLSRQV